MFLLMILQFEPKPKDDPMLLVISIVGIIALLVIVVTVTQYEGKKEQKQLRSLLAAKGHTNIVLIKTSMTLGDGDPTYDVEYTAPNGERHKNTCKLSSNDVFWKDPI